MALLPQLARYRWPLGALALIAAGVALSLWFGAEVEGVSGRSIAERAVHRDHAEEHLARLCRGLDAGAPVPQLERACQGVASARALEAARQPLEAATRLHGLAFEQPAPDPESRLAVLLGRAERVRLLLAAGHSRQAALEGQRWAESEPDGGPGSAQLWLEAGHAQEALGNEAEAASDYRRAVEAAAGD